MVVGLGVFKVALVGLGVAGLEVRMRPIDSRKIEEMRRKKVRAHLQRKVA